MIFIIKPTVYRIYISSKQNLYQQNRIYINRTESISTVYRIYIYSIQNLYQQYTEYISTVYRIYINSIQNLYQQYTEYISTVYRIYIHLLQHVYILYTYNRAQHVVETYIDIYQWCSLPFPRKTMFELYWLLFVSKEIYRITGILCGVKFLRFWSKKMTFNFYFCGLKISAKNV